VHAEIFAVSSTRLLFHLKQFFMPNIGDSIIKQ